MDGTEISNMIGFIVCFLQFLSLGSSQGPACCGNIASNPECKNACGQLSHLVNQTEQMARLARAASHCPSNLMEFWECAGQTLPVLREMKIWHGRPCCQLTKSRICQSACLSATSEAELENYCSRSTEDMLFSCISRQRDGGECCQKAGNNPNCLSTCWNMYLSNTMTSSDSKRQLRHHCSPRHRHVVQCLQQQTKTSNSLHCCQKTSNLTCRDKCLVALKSEGKENDIINMLIEGCGRVSHLNPLYQCLLSEQEVPPYVAGIDAAKLHCCQKALSNRCSALCAKTYSRKWSSINVFEANCGYLSPPISTMEPVMHSCLKEVEEPCQLGCNGLRYCTNMNNRPTEHFRSCNAQADRTAQEDVQLWLEGVISLPNMKIPVQDIRKCEPEMWKAIACALQVKPCYKRPSPPQICMEDCVYILNKCVDQSRLPEGQMVKDLCNRLPRTDEGSCISVRQYTVESPHKGRALEVTHPCKSNPCQEGEICHIHRRKCKHNSDCRKFVCTKACKMGEVSKVLVPKNTHVIIPEYIDLNDNGDCQNFKICHCSHTGNIGNCHSMPCIKRQHCVISPGNIIAHGEHFKWDCNDCLCYSGEKICTKRACPSELATYQHTWTGIHQCECSKRYQPVCGANGKTYPSACFARCAGQKRHKTGSCFSQDPCKDTPCQAGYKCVPNKKVCFGQRNSPCDQYQCVLESYNCNSHKHDPVCDSRGEEFSNPCLLLSHGRTLAYRGHCSTEEGCENTGLVCGHNGETYTDACAAYADRTTVDYHGACRTIGLIPGLIADRSCSSVQCPAVTPSNCEGILLPWACCPVCAAQLRVLSSEKLAWTVSSVIGQGPVTIRDILNSLSNMITVAECDVFGYYSLEGDIVILLKAITHNPTSLQVQACVKEAERLEYLIETQSPTFSSHVILTPLLYASRSVPIVTMTSASPHPPHLCTVLYITAFILIQAILRTTT